MTGFWRPLEWRLRRATCRLRALPDFLLIGAPRTGTTSLYRYLVEQPAIVPAFRKETHFFNRTEEFERGACHYRANFALQATMGGRITGEATPTYLLRPRVPERVAEMIPDVKMIVILRDPVERAISSWSHFARMGLEPRSLEEAIAEELEALGDPRNDPGPAPEARPGMKDFAHVHYGRYADHLSRWYAIFDRDRFLVMTTEELAEDPTGTYLRVLAHLGVSPEAMPVFERHNAAPREQPEAKVRGWLEVYFSEPNRDLAALTGINADWIA